MYYTIFHPIGIILSTVVKRTVTVALGPRKPNSSPWWALKKCRRPLRLYRNVWLNFQYKWTRPLWYALLDCMMQTISFELYKLYFEVLSKNAVDNCNHVLVRHRSAALRGTHCMAWLPPKVAACVRCLCNLEVVWEHCLCPFGYTWFYPPFS